MIEFFEIEDLKIDQAPELIDPPPLVRLEISKHWLKAVLQAKERNTPVYLLRGASELPYFVERVKVRRLGKHNTVWLTSERSISVKKEKVVNRCQK